MLHTVTDTCSDVHKANISYWSKLELSFKIYVCKISNGIELRLACTGIPAMYNALRYSLHVCSYICYILDQNL